MLSNFISESHIDEALIRAVARQSGGWKSFKEIAGDVARYGAAGGYGGWIYYTDTCAFYARNQESILALADEMADEFGQNCVAMVMGFNCLRDTATEREVGRTLYGSKREHDTTVANALAWFALEEVCRCYADT